MIFEKGKKLTINPATRPFGVFAGSGLDVKIGYTNQNLEESIMSIVVNILFRRKWFCAKICKGDDFKRYC